MAVSRQPSRKSLDRRLLVNVLFLVLTFMCCSGMELGLSDDHDGIIVLPDDAPIGTPLADYMPQGALEIEVTANRGDCLSVLGVAHEIVLV